MPTGPTPLLDLVRSLGFGAPEPDAPAPDAFVGPQQAPAPLTGWRASIDNTLNAMVGTVKGITGLGDQGPAGPTWTNAAAMLGAALPLGKLPRFTKALETYHAPTAAGKLAQPFYSRLDEAAAALPKSTFGPRVLATVQKGEAAAEELALRKVPQFVEAAGSKPIQRAALEAHLEAHPLPQLEVTTLGGRKAPPPADLPEGYSIRELPRGNRPGPQQTHTLVGPDGIGRAFLAEGPDDVRMMAHEMVGPQIERQMELDTATLKQRFGLNVEADLDGAAEDIYLSYPDGTPLDGDELAQLPPDAVALFRRLGNHGAYLDAKANGPSAPKFAQYQVPGGDGYKETLIHLAPKKNSVPLAKLMEQRSALDEQLGMAHAEWTRRNPDGPRNPPVSIFAPQVADEYRRIQTQIDALAAKGHGYTEATSFKGPHFDQPDIVAHTRSNERELPGLGRGTYLEEIQSDWHQAGKKQGYQLGGAELEALKEERAAASKAHTATADALSEAKQRHREKTYTPAFAELQKEYQSAVNESQRLIDAGARRDYGGRYELPDTPEFRKSQQRLDDIEELMDVERQRTIQAVDAAEAANDTAYKAFQTLDKKLRAGVPHAPFKETWPDLALKHHLAEAVANPETQWLGFSTGETQAKRWGSERLTWKKREPFDAFDNQGRPQTFHPEGYEVTFEPQVAGNALGGDMGADALTRGLTKNRSKIVTSLKDLEEVMHGADVQASKGWKRIQAQPDGGTYLPRKEGMESFYDQQLPAKVDKIVKPYGGKVERVRMESDNLEQIEDAIEDLNDAQLSPEETRRQRAALDAAMKLAEDATEMWVLKMTPELREKILKGGLPFLAGVAAVDTVTKQDQ